MSNKNTAQIINVVTKINDAMVLNQDISINDLKLLLLIIYNECFDNDEPLDSLLKSYLTVVLHRFITFENNRQNNSQPVENESPSEEAKTAVLNEQIIRQLVHSRAPQLMEKA